MAYLLDANVFIQAKNLHYGFDFCPAFWDWIDHSYVLAEVFSIEKVGDELKVGNDDLAEWAMARPDEFFSRPDEAVLPGLQDVSRWAQGAGYEPAAVSAFFQVADYFLVGQALAHSHTVVTHEVVSWAPQAAVRPDPFMGSTSPAGPKRRVPPAWSQRIPVS